MFRYVWEEALFRWGSLLLGDEERTQFPGSAGLAFAGLVGCCFLGERRAGGAGELGCASSL